MSDEIFGETGAEMYRATVVPGSGALAIFSLSWGVGGGIRRQ